jgi:hypothetical protein
MKTESTVKEMLLHEIVLHNLHLLWNKDKKLFPLQGMLQIPHLTVYFVGHIIPVSVVVIT